MNNVILVGRLTRNPEKRSTQSGNVFTSITVAVTRPFKNVNGEYDSDFINCMLYKPFAESTALYCHKGDLVCVRGRIQTRNYQKEDGTKVYVTEVIAERIIFLNTKPKEHNAENDIETNTSIENDPYADMGSEVEIDESELPFDFN